MIIEYEIRKREKEIKQMEIQDPYNVFLQGKTLYDNMETYLGVWTNKKYIVIVELTNDRTITYNYSLKENSYPDIYIRQFLGYNKDVIIITKNKFKAKFGDVLEKLKI